MYEDLNSEWKFEAQSRESRLIQCQPIYRYGIEKKVRIFFFSIYLKRKKKYSFVYLEYT
jgi:hypothetical protein